MQQLGAGWFNSLLKRVYAIVFGLLIGISAIGQTDTGYSILVAGHAYGAHAGTNIGLHPPFLTKLIENKDSGIEGLFLTGDIVNLSTTASWAQVDKELTEVGIPAYYVMGNHDNNTVGKAVFNARHGGLYYSFTLHDDLYIILNSTETDRSISAPQLAFLGDALQKAGAANKRVFIFFHEVLWNSDVKYRLVRSNSRSRYAEIKEDTNFWQEVFPLLNDGNKSYYIFSGDVGGNPDAIAAFYDRRGNITLLSSGMGEVPDENYMRVDIRPDTVIFTLIPLHDEVTMRPVEWYNVPAAPTFVEGPSVVNPPESAVRYEVSTVFNATAYRWTMGNGITGSSNSSVAALSFDGLFKTGTIAVRAVNDGYGESEELKLDVQSSDYTAISEISNPGVPAIRQEGQSIMVNYTALKPARAQLKIYNLSGQLLFDQALMLQQGVNTLKVGKDYLGKGLVLLKWIMDNKQLSQKIMLY